MQFLEWDIAYRQVDWINFALLYSRIDPYTKHRMCVLQTNINIYTTHQAPLLANEGAVTLLPSYNHPTLAEDRIPTRSRADSKERILHDWFCVVA